MTAEWFMRSGAVPALALSAMLGLAACTTSTAPASSGTDAAAGEAATEAAPDAATDDAGTAPAEAQGIVATVASDPSLSILSRVLGATGVADQLQGAGPFTLFAPSDEAFNGLPPGTVDLLLQPENQERLVQILTYHVVAMRLSSGDVAGQTATLTSLEGRTLDTDGDNGVHVNNATVITPDIDATNGVIHVIDKVLIP